MTLRTEKGLLQPDSRVVFLAEKPYGDDTIKNFSFRSLMEVERESNGAYFYEL